MKRFAAVVASVALVVSAGFGLGCGRSSLGEIFIGGDASVDGPEGGGPDGGHGCRSNVDCDGTPSTPYCEVPPGKCVACETTAQCPPGDVCHDHECVPSCGAGGACGVGLSCCSALCIDENTDPADCGGCGVVCRPGEACVGGSCKFPTSCHGGPACTPDEQCCASGCANTNSDPKNCGFCGRECAAADTCVGGTCRAPTGCHDGPSCAPPAQCCATGCDDTSSDPNNCGSCGNKCAPGQACVESACKSGPSCHGEPACTGADTCCSVGCTDTKTDPENCGGCGDRCAKGDTCVAGMCQSTTTCNGGPACSGTLACCKDGCVDTTVDSSDCGGCGIVCGPGTKCVASKCQSTTMCNGGPACTGSLACCKDGCDNTTNDSKNCGGCGIACGPTEVCVASMCQSTLGCDGGPGCGTLACCTDGCKDTTSDAKNCGACGNVCPAGDKCASSKCQSTTTCNGGPACKGSLACCMDGCDDTTSDPKNCGGCGNVCPAGATCIASTCQSMVTCNGGPACTGTLACCADGCDNTTNDANDCGGCGIVCPPGDVCIGSVCQSPLGCNGGPSCGPLACCKDGCKDTTNDAANCGGCGIACPAGDKCAGSMCQSTMTCNGGPACTGTLACCKDGCDDTTSDPKNCGGCGNVCPAGDTCVASACQSTTTCNGGPACKGTLACCMDGCDDTTSNPNDCGGCGIVCPPGDTCVSSKCQSTTTCNGGPACMAPLSCCKDGCDDTTSDPNNCGGCGVACSSTEACVASTCQPAMDCNGGPPCKGSDTCCASGCSNTKNDVNNCGGCGVTCAPGDKCAGGMCKSTTGCNGGPVCSGTETCCTSGCSDTTGDPLNCGGCGMPCPPDNTCVGSACVPPITCNGGKACSPPEQCCASGCIDTTDDAANCGACGKVCPLGDSCVASACTPVTFCGTGPACSAGDTCCPSGCANTNTDASNCGGCGKTCASPGVCTGGSCSTSEGGLTPFVNPTYLTPGVHTYTTIDIPAGVTVYVAGGGTASGTLQLIATGDITIDGVIDVSGGPGTQNSITSFSTQSGSAGSGGYTGEPYQSASPSAACGYVSGNPGLLGFAAEGTAGGCTVYTGCDFMFAGPLVFTALLADYGGGAGVFTGFRAYGSGGGGAAGGAPGALGAAYPGEQDCAGVSGAGGAVSGQGGVGGGAPYDGNAGVAGQTQCAGIGPGVPPAYVGGGGGGSIGPFASADLAVVTTFQPGSGGGGGSADYLNRPQFGGSSGGGGGGGALMLSTPGTIKVTGQILANGGKGGDAFIGTGSVTGCNPQPGAGGGGGSGGLIYMSAPTINVSSSATISAVGGSGGLQSLYATGGAGGNGGLGRIRLSATTSSCTLSGSFNPPLASGCSPSSTSGDTYIGVYPN